MKWCLQKRRDIIKVMGQISSKVVDLPDAFDGLRRSGTNQAADGETDSPRVATFDETDTDSSCSVTCGSTGVKTAVRRCENGVEGDIGCEGENTKTMECKTSK